MTVPVPPSVDVLDVADQAALYTERQAGFAGESPWERMAGRAEALRWVLGLGPRPEPPAWCEDCDGHGSVGGAECFACTGSGVAP